MVHQGNRRIHSGNGFFCSFDAPWSERPSINLFNKETQNPLSDSFGLGIQSWIFLKKRTLSEHAYLLPVRWFWISDWQKLLWSQFVHNRHMTTDGSSRLTSNASLLLRTKVSRSKKKPILKWKKTGIFLKPAWSCLAKQQVLKSGFLMYRPALDSKPVLWFKRSTNLNKLLPV